MVEENIKDLMNEALEAGHFNRAIMQGIQSMVPKSGPRVQVTNFKPISVLTSTYKIIAKFLANCT
jgi:hypothetical protein